MLRKQRSGRSQTSFDGGELDTAEIGARRHPSRSISIEVLPLGFCSPALNGFYDDRLRTAGHPKTSGNTKCQRANGNDNQCTTPTALTNPSMFLQFHQPLPATALGRIIQHRSQSDRHYLGKHCSSTWIPNPGGWLHLLSPPTDQWAGTRLSLPPFQASCPRNSGQNSCFPPRVEAQRYNST